MTLGRSLDGLCCADRPAVGIKQCATNAPIRPDSITQRLYKKKTATGVALVAVILTGFSHQLKHALFFSSSNLRSNFRSKVSLCFFDAFADF